jgi:hypothetical protein
MATNPYIRQGNSNEQDLVEDLTIETIKSMGQDMIFIPRSLVNLDEILGEDTVSTFSNSFPLEMYIQSVTGFEGPGDIISQIGLDIKDRITLVVARKRFEQEITTIISSIKRPREGDLIYFPLSRTMFEINFVEHENPFYQVGKLYSYELQCEVFTYSNEDFNTGDTLIDKLESDRQGLSGDIIIPMDPVGITAGDNDKLQSEGISIIDFTDRDPFSGGNY